jgi:hypothetical protein
MKLAWLVWQDIEDTRPDIVFEEPGNYYYRVVPIVYAEILHE